jgi:hypothetical protein
MAASGVQGPALTYPLFSRAKTKPPSPMTGPSANLSKSPLPGMFYRDLVTRTREQVSKISKRANCLWIPEIRYRQDQGGKINKRDFSLWIPGYQVLLLYSLLQLLLLLLLLYMLLLLLLMMFLLLLLLKLLYLMSVEEEEC